MSQKKIRVGINGFGRIGRMVFRHGWDRSPIEFVGINSLDSVEGMAHLLKYDSSHGVFAKEVKHEGSFLIVDGRKIPVSQCKNPADIPWSAWGVDCVLECTGALKGREDAALHIKAGAKKVMISAPADDADKTFVYGVNHQDYDPSKHQIVSNASCTTNCLAPLAYVLDQNFGIEEGLMTTVHAYTNDQRILDGVHKDLRRARSAGLSMIPTSTGAAKAVGLVLPHLKGKIDGVAIRVPTANVSLVDFTFKTKKSITKAEINEALKKAAEGALKGILGFESAPLVSVDFNGNTHSSVVDSGLTQVMGSHMAKVFSWYDNEVGFSCRMLDLLTHMAHKDGLL